MATTRVMLIAVVLPIVLLVSVPTAPAQELKNAININGDDWVSWPEQTRLIVLYGVVSGMNMAVYSMSTDAKAVSGLGEKENKEFIVCGFEKYIVNGVTIAQLYKGVGEIYADEEERGIVLSDMIYFVIKWIRGCGEDEFNRVLKYIKNKGAPGAIENLIVRGEGGEIVKMYGFP